MQHFRTLDPVADRDYSVVYFCTRYINTCLWNIVDNYKIRRFFCPQLQGKLLKKGSSCLFWIKLSETFSDPCRRSSDSILKARSAALKKFFWLILFRTSTENYLSYWWMRDIYSKLPYQYRKNLKGKITCDHKIQLLLFWLVFFSRKCGWL